MPQSKPRNRMTLRISSDFPADAETVWEKLQKVKTLQYIASPYLRFAPASKDAELVWCEGATISFKLRLFGFFPFGKHTIRVHIFDRENHIVQTYESSKAVPTWNHRITLEPRDGYVRYTDEVEIGAGRLTLPVFLWSRMFYRHRQRKWLKLLKKVPHE